MPWKPREALNRDHVCPQCRAVQVQRLPLNLASRVFSNDCPNISHQHEIASNSSGRASNDTTAYYHWSEPPQFLSQERRHHARSRSVVCHADLENPTVWKPFSKEWHAAGPSHEDCHYVPQSPIVHHRELEYPPGWQPSNREWKSGGHGYCYHRRVPESPLTHHREMEYPHGWSPSPQE